MKELFSNVNKILLVLVLLLAFSTYTQHLALQVANSKLDLKAKENADLVGQVQTLTVNLQHAATINKDLNDIVTLQNDAIKAQTLLIKKYELQAAEDKKLMDELQRRGTSFNVPNTSKTAQENMDYLRKAADALKQLTVDLDSPSTEQKNGSSSLH